METKGNLNTQGDSQEFKGYNEAKKIAEERKHIHPEGKIKLLNGNLLDGYPKKKVEVQEAENGAVKNTISLDTTGTYMVIKGQRKKTEAEEEAERRKRDEEKEAFERLFTDNAFYLLMHSERILSDSRMFLAPAPNAGGLAYIGTSGFRDAVLGVFIEFWKYCPSATKFNKNGDLQVVTYMTGSPLSGSNQCVMVDEHGKGEGVLIKPFYDLWPNFTNINLGYTPCKIKYEAYSLQEVLDILHREDEEQHFDFELNRTLTHVKLELTKKIAENEKQKGENERLEFLLGKTRKRFHWFLMKKKHTQVVKFNADYEKFLARSTQKIADLQENLKLLKKQMKSGEITPKEYEKQLLPTRKELENTKYELADYFENHIKEIFPTESITLEEIKAYLNEKSSEDELSEN